MGINPTAAPATPPRIAVPEEGFRTPENQIIGRRAPAARIPAAPVADRIRFHHDAVHDAARRALFGSVPPPAGSPGRNGQGNG